MPTSEQLREGGAQIYERAKRPRHFTIILYVASNCRCLIGTGERAHSSVNTVMWQSCRLSTKHARNEACCREYEQPLYDNWKLEYVRVLESVRLKGDCWSGAWKHSVKLQSIMWKCVQLTRGQKYRMTYDIAWFPFPVLSTDRLRSEANVSRMVEIVCLGKARQFCSVRWRRLSTHNYTFPFLSCSGQQIRPSLGFAYPMARTTWLGPRKCIFGSRFYQTSLNGPRYPKPLAFWYRIRHFRSNQRSQKSLSLGHERTISVSNIH